MRRLTLLLFVALVSNVDAEAPRDAKVSVANAEFNTLMMRSTFFLEGDGSQGTCFLVGRPVSQGSTKGHVILITAAHVLENMKGETAVVTFREKNDRGYSALPVPIAIRSERQPLWTQHPSQDVAAMYITIPSNVDLDHVLLPVSKLATEADLETLELHPGDALFSLGYPMRLRHSEGQFPVLRSGFLASYPLTPLDEYPTFLYDLTIFPGNSGGPVYLCETGRFYGGISHFERSVEVIVGLISSEVLLTSKEQSLRETRETKIPLGIGIVVQAPVIRETIDLLPEKPAVSQETNRRFRLGITGESLISRPN